MSTLSDQNPDYLDKKTPELCIDVVDGPHRGAHWTLDQDHISIGRDRNNDVVLGNDEQVSRSHLILAYLNGSWTVSDSDSSNGTYIKLSSQLFRIVNRVDLYQSSLLQVGQTSFVLKWAA